MVADVGNLTPRSPDSADFVPKDFIPVSVKSEEAEDMLGIRETAKLGFEFCMLWVGHLLDWTKSESEAHLVPSF